MMRGTLNPRVFITVRKGLTALSGTNQTARNAQETDYTGRIGPDTWLLHENRAAERSYGQYRNQLSGDKWQDKGPLRNVPDNGPVRLFCMVSATGEEVGRPQGGRPTVHLLRCHKLRPRHKRLQGDDAVLLAQEGVSHIYGLFTG